MSKTFIDRAMEKTVIPSFSRLGTLARSRMFSWKPLESYSLAGRVVVITGATSGIGEAAAQRYAQLGATLVIIARNKPKTDALIEQLKRTTSNHDIHPVIADLGEQNDVRHAAASISSSWPVIDVLAHNAGALFNERKHASNGTDLSVELMVTTPFLLTGLLLDNLKAAAGTPTRQGRTVTAEPARVLNMSSGGMYTEALTVEALQMDNMAYQGAKQYARAKRAQVILSEMWADRVPTQQVAFHALHPGWVETPGITEALPGFSKVLGPLGLLRTPDEGADTLLWLSVDDQPLNSSGLFWHDRQSRSIDMSDKTRQADTAERRAQLWDWCEQHTGWQLSKN